jgi:hypothetical protein
MDSVAQKRCLPRKGEGYKTCQCSEDIKLCIIELPTRIQPNDLRWTDSELFCRRELMTSSGMCFQVDFKTRHGSSLRVEAWPNPVRIFPLYELNITKHSTSTYTYLVLLKNWWSLISSRNSTPSNWSWRFIIVLKIIQSTPTWTYLVWGRGFVAGS